MSADTLTPMPAHLLALLDAAGPGGTTVDALIVGLWGKYPPADPDECLKEHCITIRRWLRRNRPADTVVTPSPGWRAIAPADTPQRGIDRVLAVLREAHGDVVTRDVLARAQGSPSQPAEYVAVSMAIVRLRKRGHSIETIQGIGYRLAQKQPEAIPTAPGRPVLSRAAALHAQTMEGNSDAR
jgi:biotin operon repressor